MAAPGDREVPEDVDAVVVGAGIAGLAVATQLTASDVRCVVLEASPRVGGRLRTHHGPTGALDLGATWFWPGERRVAALVEELQIETHPQHLDGDAMYHAPGDVRRIAGNPLDVPAGRFRHGAASLAERLADRLGGLVTVDTPVRHIDHGPDSVTVGHPGGVISARHAVIALPPSVAIHRIEIRPGLPRELVELAAATPVWMGNIAKAVVTYAEPFWRRDGLAGAAISHAGPLREIHDMSGPGGRPAALFGFAPLPPGASTPTGPDVIAQLVEIFGDGAARPHEILVEDWRPHAAGSPARQRTPMETYGHPSYQRPTGSGRIHWASTETAPDTPGHIEGALAAAERAVAAILGELRGASADGGPGATER